MAMANQNTIINFGRTTDNLYRSLFVDAVLIVVRVFGRACR